MTFIPSVEIKKYAYALAKEFKISDVERVGKILETHVMHWMDKGIPNNFNSNISDYALGTLLFPPTFEAALRDGINPEDAMNLFEHGDRDRLANREVFCRFYKKNLPLYTLEELKILLIEFKKYLLANHSNLIEDGYPELSFSKSLWFEYNFAYNYPIKLPNYCQNGDPIKELPVNITDKLPKIREKYLQLKIDIINIFIDNWEEKNIKKLYDACVNKILEKLSEKEMLILAEVGDFQIKELDMYEKLYHSKIFSIDLWVLLEGYYWGSFKGLLYFIGYMLEELDLGVHHQIRSKILKLPTSLNFDNNDSYYKLIQNPPSVQLQIIDATEQKARMRSAEIEYWDKYWKKIIKYLVDNVVGEVSINKKVKSKEEERLEHSFNKYIKHQKENKSEAEIFDILNDAFYAKDDRQDISENQNKDYSKYEYKCLDKVHIPGTSSLYRSNEIIVNRNKINIGDSLFLLLLRLAVELKKGADGWVNIHSLDEERIITDPDKYQIYSNLRTVLKGSLIDKNGKKFIENDGSRNYRISSHPDFITYNKEKLLSHKDPDIKKLAEELPDNDK